MAFDTCADKVFRLREPTDESHTHRPVGVQVADGSISYSSASLDQKGEVVWNGSLGAQQNSEVGALIPGTLATTDTAKGGAGWSYYASPAGTILAKQTPAQMKRVLNEMKAGDHAAELDTTTGSPVIPPHVCNLIRCDLARQAHLINKQLRQANASAKASGMRVKCRSIQLMQRPVAELDLLFDGNPELFTLVDRLKTVKQLSSSAVAGLYSAASSPAEFFRDIRSFLQFYDDLEKSQQTNKDPPTPVCSFCLQYPSLDDDSSPQCRCQSIRSAPLPKIVCSHCNAPSAPNHQVFGMQLCPWCKFNTTEEAHRPRCPVCTGHDTFMRHGLIHCLDCVRAFDSAPSSVESASSSTEDKVPIFSLDPADKKSVSWGENTIVPLKDEACASIPVMPSAPDTTTASATDSSAATCGSVSDPHTNFDTPLYSALLARLQGREFCRIWQIRNLGRSRQQLAAQAQARAITTRSRTPLEFDPASTHLDDDAAHQLTHWPHKPDCICCAHGRKTMAPFVRGGAASPADNPEGTAFLTFDWVGPWTPASNGHRWLGVVSYYRPGESTPLVYTQSAPSKADGVSAVMLARARQFWHIEHSPFTLKVDGEPCLNDGYMQRYISLAILPKQQLCFHARQTNTVDSDDPPTDPDVSTLDSGGAECRVQSLRINFDTPFEVESNEQKQQEQDNQVESVAQAFNTSTIKKPRGAPPKNSTWDPTLGQYIFRPHDDKEISRRRGRPNNYEYFVDKVGYLRPINQERDFPTNHTGLGQVMSSLPYNSNSNARAERAVRLVVEQIRAILSQSGFRSSWWHLAANALPTLQVTAMNHKNSTKMKPGRYVGPVVPLGTRGLTKLPQNLRPKSKSMDSNLTPIVCAGYNVRSTLGVKVCYLGTHDGKQVLRTTFVNCKDIKWEIGEYPIKRTLAGLENVSLMTNSVLMAMGFQSCKNNTINKRRKNQSLIQCSHTNCGKWRFINTQKLQDLSASDKDQSWTCPKCAAPQENDVFLMFDKTEHEPLIENNTHINTPPLVDPPEGEPVAVEQEDVVKVFCVQTLLQSKEINGHSPLHSLPFDNEDANDTQPGRDKFAHELATAMVRRSIVTTHDVLSTARLETEKGECAYALILGDDVSSKQRNALETSIASLQASNQLDLSLVKARSIILKNRDAFKRENEEYNTFVEALDKELTALFDSGVLRAVKPDQIPPDSTIIPSMLITSKKPCGRAKCRLVACGNFLEGCDFGEVYSSTVNRGDCFAMIHYFLSSPDMSWYSVDVATAFLQSEINETTKAERKGVFLKVPKVCTDHAKTSKLDVQLETVWEICKSIYGLRTAPADWQATLTNKLKAAGFKPMLLDESVLISLHDEKTGCRTVVACFVDDINVFGPDKDAKAVIELIQTKFKVSAPPVHVNKCTSAENALMYLAQQYWIETRPDDGKKVLVISMERYIEECLVRHNKEDVPHVRELNDKWFNKDSLKHGAPLNAEQHKAYRGGVAALGYLSQSMRFDISVPINMLQSQQAAPYMGAQIALDNVWGYVSRTRSRRFEIPLGIPWDEIEVVTYSDANFLTDESPRGGHMVGLRSRSRPDVFLPLYWKTGKQKCILMSTTESELVQLAQACKSSIGCLKMIEGWKPRDTILKNILILGDNRAANLIASGCASPRKVRHLCLSSLFVREVRACPQQYGIDECRVESVPGETNLGDVFTKVLGEKRLVMLNLIAQMHDPVVSPTPTKSNDP